MSTMLDSGSIPAPILTTAAGTIADAYSNGVGTALQARNVVVGEQGTVVAKWNANAQRMDLLAALGGANICCICQGLGLTYTGLTATVGVGYCIVQGLVEIAAPVTGVTLTNNAQNYLWVLPAGTIQVVVGSTAAPAAVACYLGCLTTASGAVTDYDTSGVFYKRGGFVWRQTADAGVPADTPSGAIGFLTQTLGGLYLWDGANYYWLLDANGQIPNARLDPTIAPGVVALTDGASIAVDATLGHEFSCTIAGNRTIANPTGAYDGQKMLFRIRQDATGGRTLAFDTKFRLGADVTNVTINTGANKTSYYSVIYDAANDKFDIVAVSRGH